MAGRAANAVDHLHTIVTEAIDAIAEPTEARSILAEALTSAGLPALPSRPSTLGLFVSVWLRGALSRRMGDVTANLVEAEISLAIDRSLSADGSLPAPATGVRACRPHDDSDARATLPVLTDDPCRTPIVTPLDGRMVVVATSDARAASDFTRLEDALTHVVVVKSAAELTSALEEREDREPIVILDGAASTVPAVMLATSRVALPRGTRVVLFRYDPRLVDTLRTLSPDVAGWHAIRRGARAVDVLAYADCMIA